MDNIKTFSAINSMRRDFIRSVLLCATWYLWFYLLSVQGAPPNFIFILGEGSGWTSSSVQMDDQRPESKAIGISTPNLERLANMGMRFSDGYAASPRCTPSRAAYLTGRSAAALHMTFVGMGQRTFESPARLVTPQPILELPASETTVADMLKTLGYRTAHFGKWHLGRVSPNRHGFDQSDGPTGNRGPENVANPNPKQAWAMTTNGIRFMEESIRAGRPFYLQMSHYPDQPEEGKRPERPSVYDVETSQTVDRCVGMILDAIQRLAIQTNTYIIYTTDHGTPGRNRPLRGGKGTVWEGGIRVPFLVAGPGVAPGTCSHIRVSSLDLFPTLGELAGFHGKLPTGLEGGSLVPLLLNHGMGSIHRIREEFVIHFPHYDKDPDGPASALLLGPFKCIHYYENGESRLIDLSKDLAEENDLTNQLPEKAAKMTQILREYLETVGAELPKIQTNSPPSQAIPQKRGKGRRNSSPTQESP